MKLRTFIAAAALTTAAMGTQAATVTGNFNVLITLTAACQISTAPSAINLTYTSFQGTSATGNTPFGVKCTNTLPYTMALDSGATTDNAVNLAYTTTLSAASGTGTGVEQTYSVTATIASGQAGTCATTAACNNTAATNKQRTLTITY